MALGGQKLNAGPKVGDVRQLRELWVAAFNRHDVERLVSFYAEDAVELPLNGAPAVHGISALRELVKSIFAVGFCELKVWQTQVGYTDPLAVELATYTVRPWPGNGGSRKEEKGRLVATWRRVENGPYKITISVWSKESA
jgi:ketosteroid isomerase-like protein